MGMRCGGGTLGAGDGGCVAAAGRRRTEGAHCTGSRSTLGDGAHGAGERSGTARGDRGLAAESKIVASWQMACSWSWPSVAKGAAGYGLTRVSIKSQPARWVLSGEDVWSMAQFWGGRFDGLGDAFGGRGRYVDKVAAILLGGCANVPAVAAMTGLRAADGRGFMDKYLSAGWCKGQAIEIVGAVDLGFGRKVRVDAGYPK